MDANMLKSSESLNIDIVNKEEIPAISHIEHEGIKHTLGEVRDFLWHPLLKNFMPEAEDLSISFVKLKEGEILQPHVHPIQSMMIFYQGEGELIGALKQKIVAGDIIVVPPGEEHGFKGGTGGLFALSIQFGEGLYTHTEKPKVSFSTREFNLSDLLAFNQECLEKFKQKTIFKLFKEEFFKDPQKIENFLNAMQIWVDGNQTLLFTRQATVTAEKYKNIFLAHMLDEMGHEKLHKDNIVQKQKPKLSKFKDPILEAITNWFSYQMLILDNVEKAAIVHLVIENGSIIFHTLAKPHLKDFINTEYFDLHINADAEHAALGEILLEDQNSYTYAHLKEIINQAWEMLGAMTDRVVELTLAPPNANEVINEYKSLKEAVI